ncbi:Outer membrane protein assembly factor BamB precursor [Vibrio aerogenes CECT 7868]|uniref:Outer membrane protein assembly factor BamB n=1 Tax=Vibrio aerogenes CECT 7868 TaxID=1216006 RepID=A0A1M5YX42_9VIBR|nr:outer membrane protein assembly factor BamB [Vibrio aerogenes]SHI16601.1 Outer membrane protein assembly factor BamB precursor [Vibrio aerogenes CECT 7868]
MKKWFGSLLFATMIAGGLSGCSSEEDSVVMAPVPDVQSQFQPETDWSASVGHGVEHYFSRLRPHSAYGKIFVASRDGIVKALDPTTGKTLWEKDLGDEEQTFLSGGISTGLNQLYIGSETGILYAMDAETGELKWKQDVSGEILAAPVTESDLVIIHTSEGNLIALEQKTGKQQWTISTEVPNLTLRGDSTPVTVSGGIFWGTANGRLAAAIASSGQMIWQQSIGTPKGATEIDRLIDVDSSPLVIGSTLYTVGYNGKLVAIDLRSGKPLWKRNYSSATNIATDGGKIFVVTDQDYLTAVDARSGTEIWTNRQLENRLVTEPVIIHNYVVVGDSEGYLYWIDRNTGEFVSEQHVSSSGFAVAPIVLSDGGYLVMTRDGDVKKLTINQ